MPRVIPRPSGLAPVSGQSEVRSNRHLRISSLRIMMRYLKLLFLAIRNAGVYGRRPIAPTAAIGQFAILFCDRVEPSARSRLKTMTQGSPYTEIRTLPAGSPVPASITSTIWPA